jgi:hypothetical protein
VVEKNPTCCERWTCSVSEKYWRILLVFQNEQKRGSWRLVERQIWANNTDVVAGSWARRLSNATNVPARSKICDLHTRSLRAYFESRTVSIRRIYNTCFKPYILDRWPMGRATVPKTVNDKFVFIHFTQVRNHLQIHVVVSKKRN